MMKFRLVEPLPVELADGTTCNLRLTMYGLRKAEQKFSELRGTKQTIFALIDEEMKSVSQDMASMDFISILFWAARLEQEPDLDLVESEMQLQDPVAAFTQVLLLVKRAFFGKEDADVPEPAIDPAGEAGSESPLPQSNGALSGPSPD